MKILSGGGSEKIVGLGGGGGFKNLYTSKPTGRRGTASEGGC